MSAFEKLPDRAKRPGWVESGRSLDRRASWHVRRAHHPIVASAVDAAVNTGTTQFRFDVVAPMVTPGRAFSLWLLYDLRDDEFHRGHDRGRCLLMTFGILSILLRVEH
jgi:hypothetical protein